MMLGHRSRSKATGAEIRCHTKGGDAIDIEFSAATLPTDGNLISEVPFLAANVTELKKTREKMLPQERLAAIGETAASLSHESRNALCRIQLGIDVLEQGQLKPAEIGEITQEIRDACKDLQYRCRSGKTPFLKTELGREPSCPLSFQTFQPINKNNRQNALEWFLHHDRMIRKEAEL